MYLVKKFDNFSDAGDFERLIKKYGAVETKITAKYVARNGGWNINVLGKFN